MLGLLWVLACGEDRQVVDNLEIVVEEVACTESNPTWALTLGDRAPLSVQAFVLENNGEWRTTSINHADGEANCGEVGTTLRIVKTYLPEDTE